MEIFHSIDEASFPSGPLELTIGNFDGVHLGHQAVLKALCPHQVVVTFDNHPLSILAAQSPPLLTLPSHRLALLREFGVRTVCLLPFTKNLSRLTAHLFLKRLRVKIPFSKLLLGYDAVIGHNREGTPDRLRAIASDMNFEIAYLPPVTVNHEIVSSRLIRAALVAGQLDKASALLGRPYSICGPVAQGAGMGHTVGYRTANLSVGTLALPPFGVYIATVYHQGRLLQALVNLGQAPTLHLNRAPTLEVHVLGEHLNLYDQDIEVVFLKFVRPEHHFSSVQALQEQIQNDLLVAKRYFDRGKS